MWKYVINHIKKSPHRNELESYLKRFLPGLSGRVLDIGSKNRRYDNLLKSRPVSLDLVENKENDVQKGDINKLDFAAESFDNILCLEVLEYLDSPLSAIGEISRVLKSSGTAVVSVPFMYKYHEDELRYTKSYLKKHFEDNFSEVKIYEVGNFYTLILDILWGKIKKINILFKYLLTILFLPLILLIPLSKISKDKNYCSGYFIVAKK